VIDRESILSDAKILAAIRERYVPVTIDQWYTRKQKDPEGEFYRKLVAQSPRTDPNQTTQGFYLASPDGTLLGYNNHRDIERFTQFVKDGAARFDKASAQSASKVDGQTREKKWNYQPPAGGFVGRVHAKVLGGYPEDPEAHPYKIAMQNAVSVDSLWATKEEKAALLAGQFPSTLAERISRYHLIDSTRGEPQMWLRDEIELMEFKTSPNTSQDGYVTTGEVSLRSKDGTRGYRCAVECRVTGNADRGELTRFELVGRGNHWGEGQYTKGAPKGLFPLAVTIVLADPDGPQGEVFPQGSKGWLDGYLNPQ